MKLEEIRDFLNRVLESEQFTNIQETVFIRSWEGLTYPEIAEEIGYDTEYIKHVGFQVWQLLSQVLNTKVSKHNFRAVLSRYASKEKDGEQYTERNIPTPQQPNNYGEVTPQSHLSWGEAINISSFYGRSQEIALLEQWIVTDRCCLIAILGMGGMGKTSLSVKVAQQLQDKFDCLIWRSLRNAPPIVDLLADLLTVVGNSSFSRELETDLAHINKGTEKLLSELLEHLHNSRCLIILDNVESIFHSGRYTGTYREGYEDYGELFTQVGEVSHQSCLVLTSREKPNEVSVLEGNRLPVRSLNLHGLQVEDAREIVKTSGLTGSEDEVVKLIECYRGNPLALRIVANSIHDLFDNEIGAFLAEGTFVSSGIHHLLDQQFQRLTDLEKQVMYWLAIAREWMTVAELKSDIVPKVSTNNLLKALESLVRRSLIEQKAGSFTQQPVVMEYVTEQLISQVCDEIVGQTGGMEIWSLIPLFKSHALLKAHTQDHLREAQVQLILKPLIDELIYKLGTKHNIEVRLAQILDTQRSLAWRQAKSEGDATQTPITNNEDEDEDEDIERTPLEQGYVGGNVLNLMIAMGCDLTGWDFSHIVIREAYLSKANLHRVNFSGSDLSRSIFTQTFGSILSVSFSPDGKLLATGESSGEIYLWRVSDLQLLSVLIGHTGWVWSVNFSPDGKILASGSADRTIRLWDVATGEALRVLHGRQDAIWSVAFSLDGTLLASGSHDAEGTLHERSIELWDLATGKNVKTLRGHSGWIQSVAFCPDGKTLASASADKTIKLWSISTGENIKTIQVEGDAACTLAFSPNDNILASGSSDCTIKLFNHSTGKILSTWTGHTNRVSSLAFSPDGTILASSSLDRTVRLWDTSNGKTLQVLQGHTNSVWSVAFSPDGQFLVSGGADQTVRFWHTSSGQNFRKLYGYSNPICTLAFSPNGQMLASGSLCGNIRLWDVSTGKKLKTLKGHSNSVSSVAFSPDGKMLASGSHDLTVRIWDVSTGLTVKTFKGHSNSVWSVAFSPDGKMLVSGSHDRTIRLWDVSTGLMLKTLEGHTNSVCAVDWSSDGQMIASSSDDHTIRLWDVHTGQTLRSLEGHTSWVWAIAFSPDSKTLASGSLDQTVRLWDVSTGKNLRIWQEHTQLVRSVAFSPDGKTLASGGDDQKVRLWDIERQDAISCLHGHSNWIWSVAFSPDGNTLASSSEDETIKLWSIIDSKCLNTLKAECPYEGMNITEVIGISDVLRSTLKALGAVETF